MPDEYILDEHIDKEKLDEFFQENIRILGIVAMDTELDFSDNHNIKDVRVYNHAFCYDVLEKYTFWKCLDCGAEIEYKNRNINAVLDHIINEHRDQIT